MSVATFTKAGTKASTAVKLEAAIFSQLPKNHELLKVAYLSYLANGRPNLAVTKKRGQVSGGGKKPWRQKGTGRARFGSSRNPIWRGGGIAFGPTGMENYQITVPVQTKRLALRQALSLASKDSKLLIIEDLALKGKQTKDVVKLLDKLSIKGQILLVVDNFEGQSRLPLRNIAKVSLIGARSLNVYQLMNADSIVITKPALSVINEWLAPKPSRSKS